MSDLPQRSAPYRAVEWIGSFDGHLRLLDQTVLPTRLEYLDCRTVEEVWEAIKTLRVRGAPAIGVAAAFGVYLAAQNCDQAEIEETALKACDYLATSRPTAVNLFWALDRMRQVFRRVHYAPPGVDVRRDALLLEAQFIRNEDAAMCRRIGECGAKLIRSGMGIFTHCNTGALATADYGTALACMIIAAEQGKTLEVFADETRPLLQGARLTTWELQQHRIPVTLICDSMAAQVMKEGRVQMVIVGADRIAANGDTANKIGTYGVAVLARAHHIPFYVAAPSSTFDLKLPNGDGIPIEQRDPKEITHGFGKQTAPDGIQVYNPAFDVTPAELITGLITEKGLIQPVNAATIASTLG
jgi:methylthioribose-1-phosphate isomerase